MSKKLKFLATMLTCILLNVNYASGDSYTWTMAVGDFGTTDSPSTSLSSKGSPSKDWSVSYTWNQEAYIGTSLDNNDRGLQLGAGKKSSGNKAYRHLNSLVLSTSGISGTISEVAIETAGASSITATVGVVVGSTSFTCKSENTASLTSSNSSYSFTGSASGTITITWSQPSTQKAIYVKSITITYSAGSTKTLSSIAITKQPTLKYVVGETFSNTGAVVTATYSDGTTADVSSSTTWTPTGTLSEGTGQTATASYTEGGVTKNATTTIDVYAATMQARDEDGNEIGVGGPDAPSRTGASITPADDAGNYVFKEWQITNASLGSSESTKENTITNPTGAVTVTAVYYKPITITYKANGSTFTTQTYAYNGTLAFPANNLDGATYSCPGKTFVGWVGEANKDYSHASIAPTYATDGGSVTAAATYYAVFADATPSTDYKQITAEGDLVAGARYLIVGYASPTYKALPVDAATSLTTVTVSSSTISNPGSTLIWTLEGSADAWKIKSTNNNKYLQISNGSLTFENSTSLTFSVGVSPNVFTFTSSAASGNKVLSYYASQNKFNAYTKANTVYVFKQKITYSGYRTACCDDPQLTFGTIASPVTEYVIVREDLASASAGVEIDCNFESNNTSEDITWYSTHRDKNDYVGAYTWTSSQPTDRLEITNKKIIAKETGSWQITIAQAMGSTNYCDETATVNIIVKTVDKFIDNVNGNFSGEAQRLEDTGNGIVLPTAETFSTDNGCVDGTTRRLLGWIKASDLATYASGRRVDMIDDLKTLDPATNKVIAPGTKVQATGVTWYAVWGVEK